MVSKFYDIASVLDNINDNTKTWGQRIEYCKGAINSGNLTDGFIRSLPGKISCALRNKGEPIKLELAWKEDQTENEGIVLGFLERLNHNLTRNLAYFGIDDLLSNNIDISALLDFCLYDAVGDVETAFSCLEKFMAANKRAPLKIQLKIIGVLVANNNLIYKNLIVDLLNDKEEPLLERFRMCKEIMRIGTFTSQDIKMIVAAMGGAYRLLPWENHDENDANTLKKYFHAIYMILVCCKGADLFITESLRPYCEYRAVAMCYEAKDDKLCLDANNKAGDMFVLYLESVCEKDSFVGKMTYLWLLANEGFLVKEVATKIMAIVNKWWEQLGSEAKGKEHVRQNLAYVLNIFQDKGLIDGAIVEQYGHACGKYRQLAVIGNDDHVETNGKTQAKKSTAPTIAMRSKSEKSVVSMAKSLWRVSLAGISDYKEPLSEDAAAANMMLRR